MFNSKEENTYTNATIVSWPREMQYPASSFEGYPKTSTDMGERRDDEDTVDVLLAQLDGWVEDGNNSPHSVLNSTTVLPKVTCTEASAVAFILIQE
jgi:hypothetical protein